MKDTQSLTCPDCGEELEIPVNSTHLRCSQCGVVRFILSGGAGDRSAPALTNYILAGEVRELEVQLHALVERWGPVELARNIGLILVLTGIGYALLSSMAHLSLLNYGVYAILSGIILHGASHLVGRDYYIQKAFLEELILIKRSEIEQHRSRSLSSGKISL